MTAGPEQVLAVAGMPRSGTSWLGEILHSVPTVAYCFQPLFAYAFRGRLRHDSTAAEMRALFAELLRSDDAFVRQNDQRRCGLLPQFDSLDAGQRRVLAFKTCRFQYLLPKLLRRLPEFRMVGLVRHPCGAIHSWLTNPREFPAGASAADEWRFGACKNQGREEEFFGFYKWKETAHLYLDLQEQHPDRVWIVQYESLVREPLEQTQRLLEFAGLPLTDSTRSFLRQCHATHLDSPYAVFKDKSVASRWRAELSPEIRQEIEQELQGTRLARFLVEREE